jgi:hypothetical protein
MQPRVEVDKRQILPLLGREVFCSGTHAGHPIQLFVQASHERGGRDECTLSGRTEPNRAGRTHSAFEWRQARRAQAQASADFAGCRRRRERRSNRHRCRRKRLDYLPDQAPLRARQPGGGAERRAAPRSGPQALGEGGSPAGCDGLFEPTQRPGALDPGTPGGELVRLTEHDDVSRETVRRRLAENDLALAQGHGCIPQVDGGTSPAWRMCSTSMPNSPIRAPGGLLRRES